MPGELLRRHVRKGSEDSALARQRCAAGRNGRKRDQVWARVKLGETKVEQLHTRLRHHDVARLQISMNESLSMRVVEGISQFDGIADHILNRKRTSHEPIRQRMSFEVLHDKETNRFAACGSDFNRLADVVHGADVGVIEGGDGASFAFEAGPSISVQRKLFGKNLDGDRAIESYVSRLVYLAHAAGTNQPDDLVGSEANTGRKRHWFGSGLYGELADFTGPRKCERRSTVRQLWTQSFGFPVPSSVPLMYQF